LVLGAVDEALEHDRPIADWREGPRRDGQVVAHDVELRERRLAREVALAGMRDAHLAAIDGEDFDFLGFAHGGKATRATAGAAFRACGCRSIERNGSFAGLPRTPAAS